MFSDHDETSPSIAAVSAPSVARFILAVQQQKKNKNREKGVKKSSNELR